MRRSVMLDANRREKPNVWRGGAKKPRDRERFMRKRERQESLDIRLRVPEEESQEYERQLALLRDTPVPRAQSGRLAHV